MSATETTPGYICPFCGTDCSPIAASGACAHFFLVDGENGWRFTALSRPLYETATAAEPTLFRDLLYHDAECRRYLRIKRSLYDDSLEMYVYSEQPEETAQAFTSAIEKAQA